MPINANDYLTDEEKKKMDEDARKYQDDVNGFSVPDITSLPSTDSTQINKKEILKRLLAKKKNR